jgi:hypothetical protein
MRWQGSSLAAVAGLVLATIGGTACSGNSDVVDQTPLEPTRDTRISSLASDGCAQYADCKGYGTATGQSYATKGDCETDLKSKATTLWSDADCGHGQINNDHYETCVNSVKTLVCSDNFLQQLATLSDCTAAKVCTDPAK